MDMERILFKPVKSDPDAVYGKVWQKINRDRDRVRRTGVFYRYAAVASAVALLIVSSLLVSALHDRTATRHVDVVASAGSKTRITLPDGSSVWLNSNAKMRYPEKFTGKFREVELEGEAYFEVANDRGHPFIVNTDGMRVRVLGTSFNLHTGSEDAEVIEVTLTEGSVALFTPNNDSDVADRVLSPNQQAIYDPESHTLQVREVRPELYSSWMTGTFVFENNSLQDIAMSLERAFNTHIHIEGEELKNVHLTARFSHGETLDEILSRLEAPAKYQYLRSEGSVYIRPLRR